MSAALEAALEQFEGLYPETIELSLGRIEDLLETLGRPQDKLPPTIHVAGTNGKGSTCAYLRAMAEEAGLNVHVYTSPHLVRFNERIRLAGELVTDAALVDWLDRVHAALEGRPITRFEATTATALLAFSEVPADLLILEVGLGGRFDATNVINNPALSVITPVDFDHKQFLGSDLAKIAGEKAGIIKPGRPVVSAIQARVCGDVIRDRAEALGAPLTALRMEDIEKVPERVALPGTHQRYNAALAGLAMRTLAHPKISDAAIWQGAQSAVWPARMQRLADGPLTALANGAEVWLDGGHNPHAATAIAELLREMGGRTVMVTAMIASKDHGGFFHAFKGAAEAVYTIPNAPGHAGADPDELAETARTFLPRAEAFDSLEAALAAATKTQPDRILIGGSLYLAGEVLEKNQELPV
ncbi:MAG: bifunctional folylpolyglutamate synthase/dihydrofolate synthase [Hyphomonadaceae bacterium]|nr:bifunctional folylpolyglutamate synthase/dihydrofolate synthase [Hyphomonadaceae bacterium]